MYLDIYACTLIPSEGETSTKQEWIGRNCLEDQWYAAFRATADKPRELPPDPYVDQIVVVQPVDITSRVLPYVRSSMDGVRSWLNTDKLTSDEFSFFQVSWKED